MAIEFRLETYDFSNDIGVEPKDRQGVKMAAMVKAGWKRAETALSDVYLMVLWERETPDDDGEQPQEGAGSG